MANFKFFADINGTAIELQKVGHDGSVSTKACHFVGFTPEGAKVAATRKVQLKSNPSLHKCSARCLNATGFLCECECGGKNHGAGNFECKEAA